MQFQLLALLIFFESFFACRQLPDQKLSFASINTDPEHSLLDSPGYLAADIIYQSVDAGNTWRDISAGLPEGAAPVSLMISGDEVLLGGDGGLFRGAGAVFPIWEKEFLLDDRVTGIFPGAAGPYIVTGWHGFSQNWPGTSLWMSKSATLDEPTVQTVLETRDAVLLVGGGTGIFRSNDGGNNWKKVYEKCIVRNIVEAGNMLIAGSNKGILQSADGGETWQMVLPTNNDVISVRVVDGGIAALVEGKMDENGGRTNDHDFSSDSTQNRTPQAESGGRINGYYFSSDQGTNWQNRTASLPSELNSIYSLVQAGNHLFACSEKGVYRSADQGKTWDQIRPAPANKGSIYQIAVTEKAIFALLIFGC
ncbi:MAG: hypothetical protein JNL02_18505 [Saprospiraceae bacterium]|nr:hypothetical protein [Saprospiraceae bacterium]